MYRMAECTFGDTVPLTSTVRAGGPCVIVAPLPRETVHPWGTLPQGNISILGNVDVPFKEHLVPQNALCIPQGSTDPCGSTVHPGGGGCTSRRTVYRQNKLQEGSSRQRFFTNDLKLQRIPTHLNSVLFVHYHYSLFCSLGSALFLSFYSISIIILFIIFCTECYNEIFLVQLNFMAFLRYWKFYIFCSVALAAPSQGLAGWWEKQIHFCMFQVNACLCAILILASTPLILLGVHCLALITDLTADHVTKSS